MLFPEKLRQLRAESGLKQKDIAKKIGVDIPMYSRFEHGERRPKRETVVKLAKIYGTDVDQLVALWLAFAALNEIGTDKLADKALVYLREELGEAPVPTSVPTEAPAPVEAAPQPKFHIEIPTIDPAKQNIVTLLGDSPFPQYYNGEALNLLSRVENDSIDCIVTSPPYWSLRRYGAESINTDNIDEFIESIVAVMGQLHRVIKPSGWILRNDVEWDKQSSAFDSSFDHLRNTHEFIFHFVKSDDFYYDDEELRLFFNNVTEKKAKEGKTSSGVTGMKYRRNVMSSTALTDEEKQNALAELDKVVDMVNNGEIPDFRMFIRTAEGQVMESKSEKAKSINEKGYYFLLYNKNGTMPSDVWNITPANSPVERYNVFPESLCHLMILSTCPDGGIVLDPYCGLGTACKVAYDLHRRAIGFDVNESYLQKAKEKIQQQPLSLF